MISGTLYRAWRVGLLALGLGILIPGCFYVVYPHRHVYYEEEESPRPSRETKEVEPARPVREYYYYPGAGVYYDPVAVEWFWYEGSEWRRGRDLPRDIVVDEGERVRVRTNAARPYDIDDWVRKNAPGNKDLYHKESIYRKRVYEEKRVYPD
jgi:hypothetical protein